MTRGGQQAADERTALWRLPGMAGLLTVTLAGFTSYAIEMTTAPLWAARGGASAGRVGLVTGVLMLTTVCAQLTVPAQVRRLGLPGAMAVGLVFLGGGSLLYLASDALVPVLVVSALRGVGFATLTVGCATALAALAPPGRLGEAAGLYGLVVAVPNILGLPAGVWLAEHVGFPLVFAIGAAPLLAVPAALLALRGHDAGPVEGSGYDLGLVRRIAGPCLALFVVTVAGGTVMTFVPLTDRLGGVVTVALLLFGVAGALGRWRAGVVVDRLGPDRLAVPLLVTAAAGMLCIAVAAGEDGLAWLALVGSLLAGLGYGVLQNSTLVATMTRVGRDRQPAASALWNGSFDLGTGVGGAVAGVLIGAAGFGAGYAASAGLIAAVAVLLGVRRQASSASTIR
ncbi:MAG TPA: MFS transporter [Marmoricola sp.]|nr:MFS transporter [Marmoricola sp.]